MSAARRSPLEAWFEHEAIAPRAPLANASLWLEDLSWRVRCGCKGPGAQDWLAAQGCGIPAAPNSAALDADGVLVARLASSEFLIEATATATATQRVAALQAQLSERGQPPSVYPVARQDLVIEVGGARLKPLLRQICSVDFESLLEAPEAGGGPILLTAMIGVSVVAWARRAAAGPVVTLWSDPSFAHYFWDTLHEVGQAGGSVAIKQAEHIGRGE